MERYLAKMVLNIVTVDNIRNILYFALVLLNYTLNPQIKVFHI